MGLWEQNLRLLQLLLIICEMFNIPHYIKPSNYSDMLLKNGYNDCKNVEDREKLMLKLYNSDLIDKITYKGRLNYIEFKNIKTNNKLSLARVNELHKDLKKFIYTDKTNECIFDF